MQNNKAQGIGRFTFIFSIIFTLIIISIAGGQIFNLWTVATPTWLGDFEQFLIDQHKFVIAFALVLGTVMFFYMGGRQ